MSEGHERHQDWQRRGWHRHDMMLAVIASMLFPACLASTLMDRKRTEGTKGPLIGAAYDRALSSATMIYQMPG